MPTLSLLMALIVGVALVVAACEDRRPKPAAPAFVMPLPEDPQNAFNEYAAVAASDVRLLFPKGWESLDDTAWTPDRKTAAQLKALQPEIARLIAASRRSRLDRIAPGTDAARARPVTGEDVAIVRGLLCIEARRRRVESDPDGSAACIAALLRMAKQVRSREGIMEATVQNATARMASRSAALLDLASIGPEVRAELIEAAKALRAEPAYAGPDRDEMSDRSSTDMQAHISDLLARLEAPTPR